MKGVNWVEMQQWLWKKSLDNQYIMCSWYVGRNEFESRSLTFASEFDIPLQQICPSSLLRKSSTLCCILFYVVRTCGLIWEFILLDALGKDWNKLVSRNCNLYREVACFTVFNTCFYFMLTFVGKLNFLNKLPQFTAKREFHVVMRLWLL